jgi:hypothetical protein
MTVLNADTVIVLWLVFIIGALFGAVCVEILVSRHLNRERAQIELLRRRLAPFDHDGDGKPGGSRPKPFRWNDPA